MPGHTSPIGIFDSGVGGLTVVRSIQDALPHEDLIYLADQAHVPYGQKPLQLVRQLATQVVRFLLDQDVKLVVVACNTASAAALQHLRNSFPATAFVGMEPAVKPAANRTHTRQVGVLATEATFQGELYAGLISRFAQDVTVHPHTCPGLVSEIEAGHLQSARARQILSAAIEPMLAAGVDRIVLGCTHYPFVLPLIRSIAGPGVEIIDPAPAVARQVARVLDRRRLRNSAAGGAGLRLFTTGDPITLEAALPLFLAADPSRNPPDNGRAPQAIRVTQAALPGQDPAHNAKRI